MQYPLLSFLIFWQYSSWSNCARNTVLTLTLLVIVLRIVLHIPFHHNVDVIAPLPFHRRQRPVHPMAPSANGTAPSANDTRETRKPAQPARKHEDVMSDARKAPLLHTYSSNTFRYARLSCLDSFFSSLGVSKDSPRTTAASSGLA
jgi:hypothetical protein